jgi:hypothetical protein
MRYRLRTLMIVLAIGPALIATIYFAVLTWFDIKAGVHDGVRLQYQGWENEATREAKGLPRFSKDH